MESVKHDMEANVINSIEKKENTSREILKQADAVNFQSLPSDIVKKDQFGFVQKEEKKEIDKEELQRQKLQLNARIEKWNDMLANYESYKGSDKLKSRTRKGIPDNLRGRVWQIFANIKSKYKEGLYQRLSQEEGEVTENEKVILRDLDRTFPDNSFFEKKYGQGQRELYHVLLAYSRHNPDTGYVQGMGYIVATLLTYMPPESCFFMLDIILKDYGLLGLYLPGFPDLNKMFYVLLYLMRKYIPTVFEILKSNEIYPSMFASEWFITLFAKELNFGILCRIFDTFFLEGFKVIYRFALGFIKLKEEEFMKKSKEGLPGIIPLTKEILNGVEVEALFNVSFGFSLSRSFIKTAEDEYDALKGKEPKNEIMKLVDP
ncbi:MAG: TBC domain-containing protein [archaeon]|nr:TBC domain-containing protein [archaeon]